MLNPWQPDANPLSPHFENNRLTLTYTRRKLATDIAYFIDISHDLQTWDTSQTQFDQSIQLDTPTIQVIQITDKAFASGHVNTYLRLRLELLP